MARPHRLRASNPTVPAPTQEHLAVITDLMEQSPIAGPKPWSDDVERAALFHVTRASTPLMALCSAGVPKGTATAWLSDEPPPCYHSACTALSERLKSASELCSKTLLGRIYAASEDPKHWTAAAWIMERSRGYVVKQDTDNGPKVVVNIGQLTVNQGQSAALPRAQWDDVIEGESVIPDQLSTGSEPTHNQ